MTRQQYRKAFDSLDVRDGFEAETESLLRAVMAERNSMKNRKLVSVLVIAVLMFVLAAGSVYAAVKLMTPSQVAENLYDKPLAEAFASDDAVIIDETMQTGDYNITLMGIVSGRNISEWGDVDEDRSYVAVAVERVDGTPMTSYYDHEIRLSPLVEGYQPWFVNIFSLCDGGANCLAIDGVYYYIFAFETLEIFADREVAFYAYSENLAPGPEIFSFDEETGEIDYAKGYTGVRGKISLPLDPSKADSEAVKAHLESVGFTLNEDGSINIEE